MTAEPAAVDLLDATALAQEIEREEGRRRCVYLDSLGYSTIGVGRLVDGRRGGGLSDEEIDHLLANDIRRHALELEEHWPPFRALAATEPVRARALVNMAFQLGVQGLLAFQHSLGYIERRQWNQAADALLASKWAQQTPARARRIATQIATGIAPV